MRLHELDVQAFGPFVDPIHIDFDELAAGGLFLLTGDTGAGKTSILDAVCFALYGEVPGDRSTAKHLRSDHAEPTAEPLVALRLSIGERTFRFTRSPAWERPKKRGTGTTRVQAHVVVEEERAGTWQALTNRLDEAGHLVTELLGMTVSQFTQVALLPQGRFQAFLRASSAERQAVLQRLFRTRRFEDVEQWLSQRRLALHRQCTAEQSRTAAVLNRLVEAGDRTPPADWDLHDLAPVVRTGDLTAWAESVCADAVAEAVRTQTRRSAALLDLERAHQTLATAEAIETARVRGQQASSILIELESSADRERQLTEALDAHQRAAPVVPSVLRADRLRAQAAAARAHVERQLQQLGSDPTPTEPTPTDPATHPTATHPTTADLEARRATTAQLLGQARAWLPREQELQAGHAKVTDLRAGLDRLEGALLEDAARRTRLGAEQRLRDQQLIRLRATAARVAADEHAVARAVEGLAAAERVLALRSDLVAAEARLRTATDQAQQLREHYLDLRERRIAGMAGELAVGLAAGCSCPVCGSAEHPAPAQIADGVSRAEEDGARTRYESADFERQAHQEALVTLRTQLGAELTRASGHERTYWRVEVDAAHERLRSSQDAAAQLPELELEHRAQADELEALAAACLRDETKRSERTRELAETTASVRRLECERTSLLAHHPRTTTVADLVSGLEELLDDLDAVCSALTEHEQAARAAAAAQAESVDLAQESGFDLPDEAVAAVLDEQVCRSHQQELRRRDDERAAAQAALADPAVADALSRPSQDLAPLREAVEDAAASRDVAHAEHARAVGREQRLRALTAELTDRVAGWRPLLAEHATVAAVCSLVEGKSADNRLKMRLSAYVLSERLRQVVAAANERLGVITGERYTLEQADARGAGEQRGGLSLRVRDEWNGHERDPATLSGGETFLVSLALALGLADTVSNEAGGTQLDTLFIDEGFGALDASTLDSVMDTLDSLRDGGRVVGLVSHVAELRNRVPMQLEVLKSRRGSTVRPLTAAG